MLCCISHNNRKAAEVKRAGTTRRRENVRCHCKKTGHHTAYTERVGYGPLHTYIRLEAAAAQRWSSLFVARFKQILHIISANMYMYDFVFGFGHSLHYIAIEANDWDCYDIETDAWAGGCMLLP
eukprot:scaffold74366_cov18-Prasinocladus_malaysianus.AAC.2